MQIFKGYVLLKELYRKAKVSCSLFYQMKDVEIEYMGGVPVVRVETVPKKYMSIARRCTDLEKLYTFTALSDELGKSKDYISVKEFSKKKKFKSKEIGNSKLFELSDEFIKFIKKDFTPFVIGKKSDEVYADEIVNMQGIKIGFY